MHSIIATVNGVPFVRLSIYDIKALQETLLRNALAEAESLAKEEKLSKAEIFNVKLQLKCNKPSIAEVIAYAQSSEGAVEVLGISLAKSKVENPKDVIAALPIPRAVEIAREIVLDVPEQEAQEQTGFTPVPSTGTPA